MSEWSSDGTNRNAGDRNDDDDDDHHIEEIQAQIWTYAVFLASVPLLYLGYTKAALCFIGIGIIYIYFGQELETKKPISTIDQYKMKYSTDTADDIVRDLNQWHIRFSQSQLPAECDSNAPAQLYHDIVLLALSILTKKYGIVQQKQKKRNPASLKHGANSTDVSPKTTNMDCDSDLTNIALVCQDAVHGCFQSSNNICNDSIVSSSLALLALVSKNESVRQRYLVSNQFPVDSEVQYKIETIVKAIDLALIRGQDYSDEPNERIAAEIQRKACLLLGALSDGNELMAQHIGQRGGIQTILNTISWYRCHNDVTCWGLWALFVLCYENHMNKIILIQLDGISILLEAMKHCSDSIEVARYGTAIMFDILRENNHPLSGDGRPPSNDPPLDIWKIRNVALSAGLHERILNVITQFSDGTNMDIYVMGREILLGTNYQGPLPEPQMALVSASRT